MDPASLIGLGVAFVAVFGAMLIEGANPTSILLPGPLVLVILGTLGAGIAGSTLKDVVRSAKQVPKALLSPVPETGRTIETVVQLADRARREGLLALEDAAREIDDEFLRGGLQSAIDGTDPEDLRTILEDRIESKRTQDRVASKFFTDLGGYAPTVGIIGTVISLVHVLENLADPGELGHLIAAAFVATLWGILSANLIWLPIGNRIRRVSDLQCAEMAITVEGLLAVQAGANPRLVGERLRSLLPPESDVKAKSAGKAAA